MLNILWLLLSLIVLFSQNPLSFGTMLSIISPLKSQMKIKVSTESYIVAITTGFNRKSVQNVRPSLCKDKRSNLHPTVRKVKEKTEGCPVGTEEVFLLQNCTIKYKNVFFKMFTFLYFGKCIIS